MANSKKRWNGVRGEMVGKRDPQPTRPKKLLGRSKKKK